jgi:hypothetical protein
MARPWRLSDLEPLFVCQSCGTRLSISGRILTGRKSTTAKGPESLTCRAITLAAKWCGQAQRTRQARRAGFDVFNLRPVRRPVAKLRPWSHLSRLNSESSW